MFLLSDNYLYRESLGSNGCEKRLWCNLFSAVAVHVNLVEKYKPGSVNLEK